MHNEYNRAMTRLARLTDTHAMSVCDAESVRIFIDPKVTWHFEGERRLSY